MSAPLHQAEPCQHCVYLGPYGRNEGDRIVDLWYCWQQGIPTVMARYSSEPDDYASGWGSSLPELAEARKRAIARGHHADA